MPGTSVLAVDRIMYKHLITYAIGGLQSVGFIDGSDRLIVLSSQGMGIFDCLTGNKIHRDNNDWWELYDEKENTVNFTWGDGRYSTEIGGLFGNRKIETVNSNWELTLSEPVADEPPFEQYKIQCVLLSDGSTSERTIIAKDGPCEHRIFGFSPTGNCLIAALSCELVIWTKSPNDQ